MIFRYKVKEKRKDPKIGDRKIIKRFAFFPLRIGNISIWLQSYYIIYRYMQPSIGFGVGSLDPEWVEIELYYYEDGEKHFVKLLVPSRFLW